MRRYIAVIWNIDDTGSVNTARTFRDGLAARPSEWALSYEAPGILVAHHIKSHIGGLLYKLTNQSGLIIGRLFRRTPDSYATVSPVVSEGDSQRLIASAGRYLIDSFWGTYVAFITDSKSKTHYVVHDPTSGMPCFYARHESVNVIFSHVADCLEFFPIRLSINQSFLTRWLVDHAISVQETGLREVFELTTGEALEISSGTTHRAVYWNPVEFSANPRIESAIEAARELRTVAQRTVDAWASCYDRISLHLSGGLDSSIVAGCLANAASRPQVSYVNLHSELTRTDEPIQFPGYDQRFVEKLMAFESGGDERYFARLVAKRWNVRMAEVQLPQATDLEAMWRTPLLTRPFANIYGVWEDDINQAIVAKENTQAFFRGLAGDSIFYASRAPSGAIDFSYLNGIRSGLWEHILSSCKVSDQSLWTILHKIWRYGILDRAVPEYDNFLRTPKLLRDELVYGLTVTDFESIVSKAVRAARLPPGKRTHTRGLEMLAYYHAGPHVDVHADYVNPLNSQLMWELLLRIPTYNLQTGGIVRGLARTAFADILPSEIQRRQSKGSGTSMLQRVLKKNREILSEHLQNGLLVREGYLDPNKLTKCLSRENPSISVEATHLQQCMAAEIWLRRWTQEIRESRIDPIRTQRRVVQ